MRRFAPGLAGAVPALLGLALAALAGPLYQPDGTPIPVGSALQSLFESMGEPLDAIEDAEVAPVAYRPGGICVFTELSRSGPYHPCIGWHNATGSKPTMVDLFETISCTDPVGTAKVLAVFSDPRYYGGDIGLWQAVGTCASIADPSTILDVGDEKLIVFSNPDYTPGGGEPGRLIHVLVYRSALNPQALYFAFEDALAGDNDFDDLVLWLTGLNLTAVPPTAPRGLQLTVCPSVVRSPGQTARIAFGLDQAGPVTLEVFGLDGRRVRTLAGGALRPPGRHQVSWDCRDGLGHPVARGLYFIRLQAGPLQTTSRVVIL